MTELASGRDLRLGREVDLAAPGSGATRAEGGAPDAAKSRPAAGLTRPSSRLWT